MRVNTSPQKLFGQQLPQQTLFSTARRLFRQPNPLQCSRHAPPCRSSATTNRHSTNRLGEPQTAPVTAQGLCLLHWRASAPPAPLRETSSPPRCVIAVGTALTGRAPHRSVLEAFPHTAPALGPRRDIASRTHRRRLGMVGPAQCPAMRTCGEFPSVEPLPSADSAHGSRTRVCSRASLVLRVRLTSPRRACRPYRPRRSPTVLTPWSRKPRGSPGETRLEFPRMLRFFDSATDARTLPLAVLALLPSP